LFHYVGNLDSPSGVRVSRGVVLRLEEAGFGNVRRQPEAFGISASI
jgi:predicted methyltransferase